MELADSALTFKPFLTITIGIIVLLFGKRINDSYSFLKDFNIPDAVTGGLIFSFLFFLVFLFSGIQIEFNLVVRDFLLVYFFTAIGINTSLHDMIRGGKPLVFLLLITTGFIFLQNLTGVTIASLFELPKPVGLLGGSMSLSGGHGTTVAWAPEISRAFGISNTMEIGIACATFGLILASLLGGPMAKVLITRYKLEPRSNKTLDVGISSDQQDAKFDYLDLLDAVIAIHISIVIGILFNKILAHLGIFVPLFVPCLFAGMLITNTIPKSFPTISGKAWPSRTPSMALIADISLGTFLSMSLMSMQLWSLANLAGPLFTILAAQFLLTVATLFLVVFPLLGRNYDAAVICAGFGGYALGSTANAMANMAAVSHRYGPSHLAFIVVPLICAVFINIVNAIMIPVFLFHL